MARTPAASRLPDEFTGLERQALDDAVLELIGFTDVVEREAIQQEIYREIRDLYTATQVREKIAQRDRRGSKKDGPSVEELAEDLWADYSDSLDLMRFPEDFFTRQNDGDFVDIPTGPIEVGTAMMETAREARAGTVRIGGEGGTVIDLGSVVRSRFVAALVRCGHSGRVRIPDEDACAAAVGLFMPYEQQLSDRVSELARQRTGDEQRQRSIARVLLKKSLAWQG